MRDLALELRLARAKLRMKQVELAEALGMSRVAISNWERGVSRPSGDNLVALAALVPEQRVRLMAAYRQSFEAEAEAVPA